MFTQKQMRDVLHSFEIYYFNDLTSIHPFCPLLRDHLRLVFVGRFIQLQILSVCTDFCANP